MIENYPKFCEMSKKQCFSYIAELLSGKTSRDCYDRYKVLRLKHSSESDARAFAEQLHKTQVKEHHNKKVLHALKKLMSESSLDDLHKLLSYLGQVQTELEAFHSCRDDTILFAH